MEKSIKQERHLKTEIVEITHKCGHVVTHKICGYHSMPFSMEEQIRKKKIYLRSINCAECFYADGEI